jgi:alkanesulfonate monooxygenase SsuD/methylene tetrahydromethanopterin reductase-like flavin-dependent oxidoreductase (luciferase family)
VAQYGDACNLSADPEVIRHKLEVLRRHCQAAGRRFDEIIKSATVGAFVINNEADAPRVSARLRGSLSSDEFPPEDGLIATADRIAERIRSVIEAGIDYVLVYIPGLADDLEPLHRFETEVLPMVSQAKTVDSTA